MQRSPVQFDIDLLRRIVSTASSARTPGDYIERLINNLHAALRLQTTSLYVIEDGGRLKLAASVGLAQDDAGKLLHEPNQGLLEHVARSRKPINLVNAEDHSAFHTTAGHAPDPNLSFLGAPIVFLDAVIGVLAAQDSRAFGFSAKQESLLVMVAAQLAGSLVQWQRDPESRPSGGPLHMQARGTTGAPGVAVGRVHLVLSGSTLHVLKDPESQGLDLEMARLQIAVKKTTNSIDKARLQLAGELGSEMLALFDFYKMMLLSDQLLGSAKRRIRAGASAFGAVRASIIKIRAAFNSLKDPLLRSRSEDIDHIGTKLLGFMAGDSYRLAPDLEHVVLLGEQVSITDIASIRPGKLAGVVTLKGSSLSHTAVLARALGIPAVMGVGYLEGVNEGDQVVLDGGAGLVYIRPSLAVVDAYAGMLKEQAQLQEELAELHDLPAETPDGIALTLLVNTGLLADASPGLSRGAQGVGLYRSELPFLAHPSLPSEERQLAIYREVLAAYNPLPVTMRILDVGGDKALPYFKVQEENPVLGCRGVRFGLQNPEILTTQLRAMLLADEGLGNLKLLLPMVTRLREVEELQAYLQRIHRTLIREGHNVRIPLMGIMVEVPAVIDVLGEIAPLIDFVSIGTNDLTQYLLAVDRGNPHVTGLFDHLHPSVLKSIHRVVSIAKRMQLECSLCGEMAADPEAVPLLVGAGIRTLSMNAHSLPLIKRLIRSLPAAKAERVFQQALGLGSESAIREMLRSEGLA